jgi:hypothetical protein
MVWYDTYGITPMLGEWDGSRLHYAIIYVCVNRSSE